MDALRAIGGTRLVAACRKRDIDYDGRLSYRDMAHVLLNTFDLPLRRDEVDAICRSLDPTNCGLCDFKKLALEVSPPKPPPPPETPAETRERERREMYRAREKVRKFFNSVMLGKGRDNGVSRMFSEINQDHDGMLTAGEIGDELRQLNLHLTPKELTLIWTCLDPNGDGTCSFAEFAAFLDDDEAGMPVASSSSSGGGGGGDADGNPSTPPRKTLKVMSGGGELPPRTEGRKLTAHHPAYQQSPLSTLLHHQAGTDQERETRGQVLEDRRLLQEINARLRLKSGSLLKALKFYAGGPRQRIPTEAFHQLLLNLGIDASRKAFMRLVLRAGTDGIVDLSKIARFCDKDAWLTSSHAGTVETHAEQVQKPGAHIIVNRKGQTIISGPKKHFAPPAGQYTFNMPGIHNEPPTGFGARHDSSRAIGLAFFDRNRALGGHPPLTSPGADHFSKGTGLNVARENRRDAWLHAQKRHTFASESGEQSELKGATSVDNLQAARGSLSVASNGAELGGRKVGHALKHDPALMPTIGVGVLATDSLQGKDSSLLNFC